MLLGCGTLWSRLVWFEGLGIIVMLLLILLFVMLLVGALRLLRMVVLLWIRLLILLLFKVFYLAGLMLMVASLRCLNCRACRRLILMLFVCIIGFVLVMIIFIVKFSLRLRSIFLIIWFGLIWLVMFVCGRRCLRFGIIMSIVIFVLARIFWFWRIMVLFMILE